MSPALRIRVAVVLTAVAAGGVVAGVVYATRQDPAQPKALCKQRPSAVVVPGVPSQNVRAVRAAFAKGPGAAARALEPLAETSPGDPVVQFNEGRALACAGFLTEATQAFRRAKKAGRDTYYEVASDNLLHPQFFTNGYPILEYFGKDPLLIQGQLQQRQFHQRSAERLYAQAARLRPGSAEAQVAAAVGRFDMDDLSASFSRLGPLVKRFPHSQSVRFHLGLLLAWTGQRALSVKEFRAARALGPRTRLGQDSDTFLQGLVATGTSGAKR
ncbi:MAG: tetratricopeptide repeat protein [Gaiellaceae bacterium]